MFNLGFSEILVLSILAIIFIGPKQLPEMARVVARLINEIKRATGDIGTTLTDFKAQTQKTLSEAQVEIHSSIDSVSQKIDESAQLAKGDSLTQKKDLETPTPDSSNSDRDDQ